MGTRDGGRAAGAQGPRGVCHLGLLREVRKRCPPLRRLGAPVRSADPPGPVPVQLLTAGRHGHKPPRRLMAEDTRRRGGKAQVRGAHRGVPQAQCPPARGAPRGSRVLRRAGAAGEIGFRLCRPIKEGHRRLIRGRHRTSCSTKQLRLISWPMPLRTFCFLQRPLAGRDTIRQLLSPSDDPAPSTSRLRTTAKP